MDAPLTDAGSTQLIIAVLSAIAVVVLLIVGLKLHPFLSLMLGAGTMGAVAQVAPLDIVASFKDGFGATMGGVGLLVALGAMVGTLLSESGGSNRIVNRIVGSVSPGALPWAMALVAAVLGLPLFFEVGVVLVVPVVILVALRTDVPIMRIGIPALAGLSILHALVPPHPGPLTAIDIFTQEGAAGNVGLTLMLGIVAAIPTLIICGPLLGRLVEKWVPVHAHALGASEGARLGGWDREEGTEGGADTTAPRDEHAGAGGADRAGEGSRSLRQPSFGAAIFIILLPVLLMLARAVAEIVIDDENNTTQQVLEFLGEPLVALLLAVLAGMWFLGFGIGMGRKRVESTVGSALPMVASIMLIVAAGGGFKQMLVDAGVDQVIATWAHDKNVNVLILGWLVAVGIRLATGSATVATSTAAGIVSGLAVGQSSTEVALMVLAIGCGSVFFSHVNDAGFWLVKEYFGLTVGQTLRSWSLMETAISVVGLGVVLAMSAVLPALT